MNSFRRLLLAAVLALVFLASRAQIPILSSYPRSKATVYLDFDGQYVQGTIWNHQGPIDAQPAGLSVSAVTEIFNRVAEDFQPFNLNITTDSNLYNKAPLLQRIRIIFTPTSAWYGSSAGASAVGSFTWGDGTPGWVFCDLLANNARYMSDAASHEIGHTLGLQNQSLYDQEGKKISEFNGGSGSGETGWAPIMGISYYKAHTGWLIGTSTISSQSIQDDMEIIAGSPNNFGFRNSSFSIDTASNPPISLTGSTQNERHYLFWHSLTVDSIDHFVIEYSKDDNHFQPLCLLSSNDLHFSWLPGEAGDLGYRIQAFHGSEKNSYYSNTVTLKSGVTEKSVRILNNPVGDNLTAISSGNFSYQLLDADGHIISRGLIVSGLNQLPAQHAPKGLLVLRWQGPTQQGVEKLIKQ